MSDHVCDRSVQFSAIKTVTFRYDGDGKLVLMDVSAVVTAIAGEHYQYSAGVGAKHYFANGVRFAERVGGATHFRSASHLPKAGCLKG
jgi:hypothetical protein